MKEIKKIVSTYQSIPDDEKVALATVVRVEGSSYRRMGARMLVSEKGTWVGGISGGCLEGDALKRARTAILKEKSSIITYDTSIDDDHQIGVGLGCNGIIDVLFQPINPLDTHNPLNLLTSLTQAERKVRKLLTVSKSKDPSFQGTLFEFTGVKSLSPLTPFADIETLAKELESHSKSTNLILKDDLTLFLEVLPPSLQLVLMGHQYDLYPLLDLINQLGWECVIVSNPEKVKARADIRVIPRNELNSLEIDTFTAIILMSHSLHTDKENLLTILNSETGYIGMLGPRVRAERIFKELKEEGHTIPEEVFNKIYAPTGLDLGATNPEEIALSILAEVKSVFSQRSAEPLRNRPVPIHDRDKPMTFK
ncbi:MAG: XdhC family protein [Cytophagales bacterium]|nr:XdhC family protein [Cytophagales bacterium]